MSVQVVPAPISMAPPAEIATSSVCSTAPSSVANVPPLPIRNAVVVSVPPSSRTSPFPMIVPAGKAAEITVSSRSNTEEEPAPSNTRAPTAAEPVRVSLSVCPARTNTARSPAPGGPPAGRQLAGLSRLPSDCWLKTYFTRFTPHGRASRRTLPAGSGDQLRLSLMVRRGAARRKGIRARHDVLIAKCRPAPRPTVGSSPTSCGRRRAGAAPYSVAITAGLPSRRPTRKSGVWAWLCASGA